MREGAVILLLCALWGALIGALVALWMAATGGRLPRRRR